MLGQRVIDNDKIPLCLVSAPPLLLTFGEGSWFAIGLAAAPRVPKSKVSWRILHCKGLTGQWPWEKTEN